MKGTRLPDGFYRIPAAGEYWRETNGNWKGCTPTGLLTNLRNHEVVEHPDGTITVTPSILVTRGPDGIPANTWHGYLTKGDWISV